MTSSNQNQLGLSDAQADYLLDILTAQNLFSHEDASAIVHALVDIGQSVATIYKEIVPKILSLRDSSSDTLKEHMWELREVFRHIDYHIHDSNIMDL